MIRQCVYYVSKLFTFYSKEIAMHAISKEYFNELRQRTLVAALEQYLATRKSKRDIASIRFILNDTPVR